MKPGDIIEWNDNCWHGVIAIVTGPSPLSSGLMKANFIFPMDMPFYDGWFHFNPNDTHAFHIIGHAELP